MVNEQIEEVRTVVLERKIAVAEANQGRPHIRLEASNGWVSLGLAELWRYRELLYFLVWRDIKVRYKQTALGAAWAVIQPFFTMIVFSVFILSGANAAVPIIVSNGVSVMAMPNRWSRPT